MTVASDPFSDIVIRNSSGVICKPSQIFSRDKREEMNQFFTKNKRGPLARVHSLTHWSKSSGSSLKEGRVGVLAVWGLAATKSWECQLHRVTEEEVGTHVFRPRPCWIGRGEPTRYPLVG